MIKEFVKLILSDDISNMSDLMYKFLHLNFDIAHYNKHGYIEYYNKKFSVLYNEQLEYEFKRKYWMPLAYSEITNEVNRMVELHKEGKLEAELASKKARKKEKNQAKTKKENTRKRGMEKQISLFDLLSIANAG